MREKREAADGPHDVVKDYWQKRYERKFSIGSSGHISFNEKYNSYVYRAYERALRTALARYVGPRVGRVFDVGSGTGYWVEFYEKAGASEIFGVDLTEISVERLRKLYPRHAFALADIGSATFIPDRRYDIVNCFDVLYYITDEKAFRIALSSLSRALTEDGVMFITDKFVDEKPTHPPFYFLFRDEAKYQEALNDAGLVCLDIIPVNHLLKKPIPFPAAYSFVKWQLSKLRIDLEGLIGALLYRIDPLFMNPDKSEIKLMVVRHR
jgi:SAM-dependent methyltransferase